MKGICLKNINYIFLSLVRVLGLIIEPVWKLSADIEQLNDRETKNNSEATAWYRKTAWFL
jgi:hypothetical protein